MKLKTLIEKETGKEYNSLDNDRRKKIIQKPPPSIMAHLVAAAREEVVEEPLERPENLQGEDQESRPKKKTRLPNQIRKSKKPTKL